MSSMEGSGRSPEQARDWLVAIESGRSSEQAGEWLDRLEQPPAWAAKVIRRALDNALDDIAGDDVGTRWQSRQDVTAALNEAMARSDVSKGVDELIACIEAGHASNQLIDAWKRHVLAEVTDVRLIQPDVSAELHWKRNVPTRLAQFMGSLDIEIVPSLGRDVAAATFSGPHRTRVVLGSDSFVDAPHAEFLVYHMFLHGIMGDLPIEGFGFWVEYRIDSQDQLVVERLKDQPYREAEARVNDAATCAMYDFYVDGQQLAVLSKSVVRETLRRGLANVPLLRSMIKDRPSVRRGVKERMPHYSRLVETARRSVARVKFREHVAVVREEWWRGIYLIWKDPDGTKWRKCIPSRRVLVRVGFRLDDVAPINHSRLHKYRDAGVLIDPDDVMWVRQMLVETTGTAIGPMSNQLAGLGDRGLAEALSERFTAPRGEGHWTELTPRVEAAITAFQGDEKA
jgi:hypothetical protein